MQTLFSTEGAETRRRFRQWREVCEDRLVPMVQHPLENEPFHACIEGTSVGAVSVTRFRLSNLIASTTSRTIRHRNNKTDQLFASIVLSGTVGSQQNGHACMSGEGDLVIRDTNSPWTIEHKGSSDVLAVSLSRNRLESMLGPAGRYAGLKVDGNLPTSALAQKFLLDLLNVADRLTSDAAERMSSIAVDLIVASVAERMAAGTPKALAGTLTVQRAKAYIEAHLGDVSLDPPSLAATVGVSLRHLHQLFHDHGRNVSDWIWKRRLEVAAERLAAPSLAHLSVGVVSYGCGFVSQPHFSRRFKDRFGVSPTDYRHAAISRHGR